MNSEKITVTIELDYISNGSNVEKIHIKQLVADISNSVIRKSDHFRNVRITTKEGDKE